MENRTSNPNLISYALLLGKALFVLIGSALLIYTIKTSDQVYLPTFIAGLTGLLIGIIEPKKGWILALLQTATMVILYLLAGVSHLKGARLELEMFSLIESVFLIFIGSFLGAFMKRAK